MRLSARLVAANRRRAPVRSIAQPRASCATARTTTVGNPRQPPAPGEDARHVRGSAAFDRPRAALEQTNGNQTKTAELLGISRRTLLHRLDQYDLPRPRKGRKPTS